MKYFFYSLLVLSFISCKSTKFDKNPPFKISNATYNYWTGGLPGASGIRIKVAYEASSEFTLKKIYFKNREGTIQTYKVKDKTFFVGSINTSKQLNNTVMDIDSKKEINNKLPSKKIPFNLKDNEAVISYKNKGKQHFFKIENIQKTNPDYYPSQPSKN